MDINLQTCLFYILAGLTGLCALMVVLTQNIVRMAAWLLFTLGGTAGVFFLLGADFVGATQLLVYVGGTLVLVVFGVMLTASGPFITMKSSAGEWAVGVVVGAMLYAVIAFAVTSQVWDNVVTFPASYQLTDKTLENLADRQVSSDTLDKLRASKLKDLHASRDFLAELNRVIPGTMPKDQEERELVKSFAAVRPDPTTSQDTAVLGAVLLNVTDAVPKANVTGLPTGQSMKREPVGYLLPFEIVSIHLLVVLLGAAYLARAKRRRGVPA